MAFDNADLLALKSELTNNPLSIGDYLPLSNSANDEANANAMNKIRVEIQIDRETIPVAEINKAIDRDEFAALSAADRQWLQLITASGTINPKSGGEVREGLLQLFGAGTETRASLTAMLTESGSRINQLFKAGTVKGGSFVTPSDVANARNAV